MKRYRWPGLTLIEILVALAVIAILAGLMLPGYFRTREQARLAACISNIRQIFMALKAYEADHGKLPVHSRRPREENWIAKLEPYVKDKRIFVCPSDPTGGREDPLLGEGNRSSYMYLYTRLHLGPGGVYRQPKTTSPLIGCDYHKDYQIVMSRYDGSAELSPRGRYPEVKIEFER